MGVKITFTVKAHDPYTRSLVVAEGYSDGSIVVRSDYTDDSIELPAELVRQIRGTLENQALERVAAYARERARDATIMRDQARSYAAYTWAQGQIDAFNEMATRAQAEKES